MRSLILTAAAFALAAAPAFAATNTAAGPQMNQSGMNQSGTNQSGMNQSGMSGSSAQMSGQNNPALRQKIHQELSQAGFTDIHVMPQSFLVHAKDSSGNPVVMAITPNSVTAVTTAPSQGNQTAENGHSTGAMGSSTMTNSAHAGSAGNGTGSTVR